MALRGGSAAPLIRSRSVSPSSSSVTTYGEPSCVPTSWMAMMLGWFRAPVARATGALNHPNIIAIHDVGTHDGSPYVVTELLEGETLRDRINGAALPPRKAIDYG